MIKTPFNSLADKLKEAKVTSVDLAWYERQHGRKFAPLPDCKLRQLAKKAGFHSSVEFLAAEFKKHHAQTGQR